MAGTLCLAAGLGPAERYRRWLAVARGEIRVVAGTGPRCSPPVGLGLVAIWDDGDDLHAEPRAPYPHAREVLALRAHRARAAALIGGFTRTAEATQPGRERLGACRDGPEGRGPQVRPRCPGDRRRRRAGQGRGGQVGPDTEPRAARRPDRPGPGASAGPGAAAGLPDRHGLRALPCGGALRHLWRPDGGIGQRRPGQLPLVRPQRRGVAVPGLRPRPAPGRGYGIPAHRRGTRPGVPRRPGRRFRWRGHDRLGTATAGAGRRDTRCEPQVDGGYAAAVLLDGWVLLGRPSLAAAQERCGGGARRR